MDATITPLGPADFELELTETAQALQPKMEAALKQYRGRVQMRGFRPGKVPTQMVRKLYGKEIAFEIAEREVQYAFEEEVLDNPDYNVIGRPTITELDYDGTGDLRAVVRFGVRPAVEIGDLSQITLTRLVHDVTDEEIDEELNGLRERFATTEPADDDAVIGDEHVLTIDLQQLDDETGAPILGQKEEDVRIPMASDNLKDELHDALTGKKAGDTFEVTLPHGDADHAHTHRYQVTVKTVEKQTLPDLDDDLASKATNGTVETLDALRADIRADLEKSWQQRQRDYTETQIVDKLSEAYPVPVPQSALALYLDSFVQRLKDRQAEQGQELPPHFDEAGFRRAMTPEAERQARWMLLRDHLTEEEGIEITDEDLDAYFAEMGGDGLDPSILRRYYQQQPGVMEQLQEKLRSDKLFDVLVDRFQYEDKDMDAVEAEIRARQEARDAEQDAASEGDDDGLEVVDATPDAEPAEASAGQPSEAAPEGEEPAK